MADDEFSQMCRDLMGQGESARGLAKTFRGYLKVEEDARAEKLAEQFQQDNLFPELDKEGEQ